MNPEPCPSCNKVPCFEGPGDFQENGSVGYVICECGELGPPVERENCFWPGQAVKAWNEASRGARA